MRDVIQRMLEAEAEAKRLTEQAEAEAERLRAEARRQVQDLMEQVRRQTRADVDRIIAAALEQAQQEKQTRLAQADAAMDSEVRIDESMRRSAVEAIVRAVCGNP